MPSIKRQATVVINYDLQFDESEPGDQPRIAIQTIFVDGKQVEPKTDQGDIATTVRWPIIDNFYDGLYVEHTFEL